MGPNVQPPIVDSIFFLRYYLESTWPLSQVLPFLTRFAAEIVHFKSHPPVYSYKPNMCAVAEAARSYLGGDAQARVESLHGTLLKNRRDQGASFSLICKVADRLFPTGSHLLSRWTAAQRRLFSFSQLHWKDFTFPCTVDSEKSLAFHPPVPDIAKF